MELENIRRWYAEEIRWNANLTDENIVKAFASVPRERFLGPGPWKFLPAALGTVYRETPTADAEHVYHNVLVALDASRGLNNGLPTWLAGIMQHGSPTVGDKVAHVGAGVGYYSAILAEIVGLAGHVLALEIDQELALRAKKNLEDRSNVTCLQGDGSRYQFDPNSLNLLFFNAGATHLQRSWITSLKDGGRLVVPLTFARDKAGQVLRVTRIKNRYRAEFVQEVYIYPFIGSRDDSHAEALHKAAETHGWKLDGEVRFDPENSDESEWITGETYWISKRTIDETEV